MMKSTIVTSTPTIDRSIQSPCFWFLTHSIPYTTAKAAAYKLIIAKIAFLMGF